MNMMLRGSALRLLFFCFLLQSQAFTQAPGTLDNQFGTSGSTQINFLTFQADCKAMGLQTDGKIVLVGQYLGGGMGNFAFARVNTNGTLDNSYGNAGKAMFPFSSASVTVSAGQVLSNNQVVAGGSVSGKPTLMRLTSSGALDNSFGTSGIADFDADFSGLSDMVVLSNGKIVGCGTADQGNGKVVAVFRRNADGSADNTFGTNGYSYADVGGLPTVTRMAVQPDGKILLTGTVYDSNTKYDLYVIRFNANGTVDNSFGTNGQVIWYLNANSAYEQGNALAVQPDGKVVVAGRIANSGPTIFTIVRFNGNGTKDNGFGTNGSTQINYFNSVDEPKAVVLQSDGKIVVSGSALNGANREIALARLNSNGTMDATFGTGGKTTTPIGTKAIGEAVVIQADGKILVGGAATVSSLARFSVARYHSGLIVGTQEKDAGFTALSVSPNPIRTGEKLTVRAELPESMDCQFQLLDMNGQLLHTYASQSIPAGKQSLELDLPMGLPAGQIMFQITSEKGVRVMPLLNIR